MTVQNQTSSSLTPHEETESRKAYAFSSGYASQSSDSFTRLATRGGVGVEKRIDGDNVTQGDKLPSQTITRG